MIGWARRFVADFRAEYARIRAEHEQRKVSVSTPSSPQPIQTAVDMVVWRARGCRAQPGMGGGIHDEFDDTCVRCWDLTHCPEHHEFTQGCLGCQAMKDPQVLGTVVHHHIDPTKQAAESELAQGREIWRT